MEIISTRKVKCVIWDLDETLWDGSLAENENVVGRLEIIDLVKKLDERGIINSICSKNIYKDAQKKLQEFGIWHYFVFPAIDFVPKGQTIKNIIDSLQLRPDSVLFIDDNIGNRNEVEYYCENIMAIDSNDAQFLSAMEQLIEQTEGTSRLGQYKIIEEKHNAKQKCVDNIRFLENSEITMCVLRNPADMIFKERIFELANRTNQLNFTKSRFGTLEELEEYIAGENSASIHHGAVFVYDKYGDYGLVGFYAFNENNKKPMLGHFFFSCRILNMGIEIALYSLLRKECHIKKYVPLEMRIGIDISYIRVIRDLDDRLRDYVTKEMKTPKDFKTSIIAGCTSGIIDHYLTDCMRPSRLDLSVVPEYGKTIHNTNYIVYTIYSDYVNAVWKEKGGFSYKKFSNNLAKFLENNREKKIYLLLASEKKLASSLRQRSFIYIIKKLKRLRAAIQGKNSSRFKRCNTIVREMAKNFNNVSIIETGEFVCAEREQHDSTHFDRMVIKRICDHINHCES